VSNETRTRLRILYLADIRFPLERANGIQTMETCHALARRGHHVTLLVRPDTQQPARDPLAFYGLPPIDTLTISRITVRGTPAMRRAQYIAAAMRHALGGSTLTRAWTRIFGGGGARTPAGAGASTGAAAAGAAGTGAASAGGAVGAGAAASAGAAAGGAFSGGRASAAAAGSYDVVLTRDLGVASMLLRWPRKRRPPVVYESHGYAPVVSGMLPELLSTAQAKAPRAAQRKAERLARRERLVWREAEGYVTITAALARDVQQQIGSVRDVHVVPDGARIDPHATFDWIGPRRPPLVAYAGHLYPWKGVDVLIEALAQVPAPALRGRIIGGHAAEPDLARLRTRAEQLGLAGRVEFTGFQPPPVVAAELAAADVLVLPNRGTAVSARYTSPLKLFEYLAAGRPIVASDLPALREVLRDNENARLVPPDDPRALAEALLAVTRDPALAVRLARGAFDTAAEYSWDRRAARLEAILQTATDVR
jgi:glycosyltransferase involved in cell wall biosynthesis